MCMLSCTPSPVNSSSTFLNHSGFSLCFTGLPHMLLQKRVLSSASGTTVSPCTPSNSSNNFFWFNSNKRFCLYCSVLLSYLSSFAPIATNLCCTSLWTTAIPFSSMRYFLSSFDLVPSFCNSFLFILFNCPKSLCSAFCFSKILLLQCGVLFSLGFLVLCPTISATTLPAARNTMFVSVIDSVLIRAISALPTTISSSSGNTPFPSLSSRSCTYCCSPSCPILLSPVHS